MGKQPKYSWETQFETADNIMRHTFTERVQVASNIKTGEVLVLVDGNIINTYWSLPAREYEALLLACEEYAYELKRKDQFKAMLAKVAVWVLIAIGVLAFMALGGENDEWTNTQFVTSKLACFGVMGGCWLTVKHTPARAAAWRKIDENIKE